MDGDPVRDASHLAGDDPVTRLERLRTEGDDPVVETGRLIRRSPRRSVSTPGRSTAGRRGGGATGWSRPVGRARAEGRMREAERAGLERLRREMSEENKRIRETGRERDAGWRTRVRTVRR
jgi:hypothetical protein